ncbi:hypothetical protein JCM13664_03440 [Methylothermus subterraneus]|nr:outer membrane lipoprotein OmlA [uncultured Gammaproteobacteria bacterium]
MRKHRILIAYFASQILTGCVYRIDVQQGNLITPNQVDQLKPGMTLNQVRYILGTPLLTNPFQPQRFDYLYSVQKAGGARQVQHLTLIFDEDGRLVGLRGDFRPQPKSDLQAHEITTIEVPARKIEKGLFETILNLFKKLRG